MIHQNFGSEIEQKSKKLSKIEEVGKNECFASSMFTSSILY